jgi:hypothetical protein
MKWFCLIQMPKQSGLTTVHPLASPMTKETSSPLSRKSTRSLRGWVAHYLRYTQGPSSGQLKMMMEFLMIWSSQMDSITKRITFKAVVSTALGPDCPRLQAFAKRHMVFNIS